MLQIVLTLAIFRMFVFSEANIIMIYLMGVLLASCAASRKLCALYSALLSVILFNFFFIEPLYSLKACDQVYPLTFLLLFLAGLFTATVTGKLLNLSILLDPVRKDGSVGEPLLFPRKGMEGEELKRCVNVQEKRVAQWAALNHRRAGACTHTLPDAMAIYLPIQDEEQVHAVMGIFLEEQRTIAEFEYSLLTAMLNETGVKLKDFFIQS